MVNYKQTLTYILENQNTESYRNVEEFKRAQSVFVIFMNKVTYWHKIELSRLMQCFLTFVLPYHFAFVIEMYQRCSIQGKIQDFGVSRSEYATSYIFEISRTRATPRQFSNIKYSLTMSK